LGVPVRVSVRVRVSVPVEGGAEEVMEGGVMEEASML